MGLESSISIDLPDWTASYIAAYEPSTSLEDRARYIIEAARKNIEHESGGPFSAGVFESESGQLVALGVNLVPSQMISCLHAEIVALSLAQKRYGTYDLASPELPRLQLITSTEPCAMCLGAIPWSGIPQVVCCAKGDDACEIGFDEGAKPEPWEKSLTDKGIELTTGCLREEAREVLQYFKQKNRQIYNGGQR